MQTGWEGRVPAVSASVRPSAFTLVLSQFSLPSFLSLLSLLAAPPQLSFLVLSQLLRLPPPTRQQFFFYITSVMNITWSRTLKVASLDEETSIRRVGKREDGGKRE